MPKDADTLAAVISALDAMYGARASNADVIYTTPARVTSIQKHFDIRTRLLPSGVWEATDEVTFDDEPGSRLNIRGQGDSPVEASQDLLEQLAAVAADTDPLSQGYSEAVSFSPFEPPELRPMRSEDPDEDRGNE